EWIVPIELEASDRGITTQKPPGLVWVAVLGVEIGPHDLRNVRHAAHVLRPEPRRSRWSCQGPPSTFSSVFAMFPMTAPLGEDARSRVKGNARHATRMAPIA